MNPASRLFAPLKFQSGFESKNRIALAPLTNSQSHTDGTLSDEEADWLRRRAEGGFGLLISCAANVSPHGQGWAGELGVYGDQHLAGLRRIAQMGRTYNTLSVVQIFHGGARSPSRLTGQIPRSASRYESELAGFEIPREITECEIADVIEDFGRAANRVVRAGCAGVEIHGANGYLITQFLSTVSNQRTDMWGGSFENRSRLLKEIFRLVRKTVGPDRLVGVRLSPEDTPTLGGISIDETLAMADWLAENGADYLHLSLWNATKLSEQFQTQRPPIVRQFADRLSGRMPLITAGKIWTRADAEKVLDLGADMIALGAVAISQPDWPQRVLENPCFEAKRFPLTPTQLAERGVSPKFVDYLRSRKWVTE